MVSDFRIVVPPSIYLIGDEVVIEGGIFEGELDLGTILADILLAGVQDDQ